MTELEATSVRRERLLEVMATNGSAHAGLYLAELARNAE